jgi:hypothetical protein
MSCWVHSHSIWEVKLAFGKVREPHLVSFNLAALLAHVHIVSFGNVGTTFDVLEEYGI